MKLETDIILEQEAFENASIRLRALSNRLETLSGQMTRLIDDLLTGLDTPAGRKFVLSYKEKLLEPMKHQAYVIGQVSENLKEARDRYGSVFEEYKAIVDQINENHY